MGARGRLRDEISNDSEKTFWTARPPLSSNRVIRVNLHFVRRTCLHGARRVLRHTLFQLFRPLFVRSSPGTLAVARNVFVFYVRMRVLWACEIRFVRLPSLFRPLFAIFFISRFPASKTFRYLRRGDPSTENNTMPAHDRQPADLTYRISIRF